MEKNNKKNSHPGDLDNLNLKDHLNASFDIDKITVSEDLIARTLKAVKESELQEERLQEAEKIRHFPVRRLVSAAAVILVLLVGIRVAQNGLPGNKKDAQINYSTGAAGDSAAESGTADIYGTTADDSALNGTADDKLAMDSTTFEIENAAPGESPESSSADAGIKEQTEGTEKGSVMGGELLSALYPVTFESVEVFNVSKKDGTDITLTKAGDKVNEFYSLLDEYPLTLKDSEDIKYDDDWSYKVEIRLAEKQAYTITFGENIRVMPGNKSQESDPAEYVTENMETLLKQMDDFFLSLK